MAGLGRKVFTRETLGSAEVNGYLMDQSVMVFATASARSAAIPTPSRAMVTKLLSTGRYEFYDGSAWQYLGGAPPAIVLCTIVSGWSAISGRAPAVSKDGSGFINLMGAMRPNSTYNPNDGSPHTSVQLPTGFRPTLAVPVSVQTSTGYHVGGIIGSDGVLNFTTSLSTSIASGVDHYIDGLRFHPTYAGGALS